MPRNNNMLAHCLGQRQVIRGDPLYQPPHGPAKASGRSGAQLRGPVERTSIPSPPLASTHRLSRRWHGERPPTMRTIPALLLLTANCGPISPTDPIASSSSSGDPATSSTSGDSLGVSSEIGSVSAPPDDATSEGPSSGSTSANPTSTSTTSGTTSASPTTSSGASSGGETCFGASCLETGCAPGLVCAEHPDTQEPLCVTPCAPPFACNEVFQFACGTTQIAVECRDGLCFPG